MMRLAWLVLLAGCATAPLAEPPPPAPAAATAPPPSTRPCLPPIPPPPVPPAPRTVDALAAYANAEARARWETAARLHDCAVQTQRLLNWSKENR
ncbi:MAG: hypothetical protein V4653_10500 [Pseudomonadota bacterium]